MGQTISLPELDVTKPQPAPYPNALAEFQRASQLNTAAAQQQAIMAQTQGQQQQNQMQAMQLHDEQLRRQLAPQYVQKDENGKITGFDNEGLYNAMLQGGADPLTVNTMRMKQVELQKSLLGLNDEQRKNAEAQHGAITDALQAVQNVYDKESKENQGNSPQAAQPSAPQAAPGTGGMPSFMLPNAPTVGAAKPGTPQSLAQPEPGQAPTQTEGALQNAVANAPRPIGPKTQAAYQQQLINLAQQRVDISRFKPVLTDAADLEDAEAQLGSFKQVQANAEQAAKTAEAAGKGAQGQAEAAKANLIPFPELGGVYNVADKTFQTMNGQTMSPAMLESKYVMNQAHKNAGQPLSPEDQAFDKSYEHMKTLVPVANFNLQNAGAGTPAQPSAMAQAVANGTMKWGDVISPRTPMTVKNQFAAEVKALNPNFDTSTYTIETKAAEKAASGQWADTRIAYNTAIDHSKQLLQSVDALNNGDVKALNNMKNFFKTEFGSPDVPTYSAIANAYNHEVTSVVSKGHITDAEVAQGGAVLPQNASPQQIRGVVAAYNSLMQSKRDELDKQIKASAGNKANSVVGNDNNQGGNFFSQFGGKPR